MTHVVIYGNQLLQKLHIHNLYILFVSAIIINIICNSYPWMMVGKMCIQIFLLTYIIDSCEF